MKKVIIYLIIVMIVISLAGCNAKKKETGNEVVEQPGTSEVVDNQDTEKEKPEEGNQDQTMNNNSNNTGNSNNQSGNTTNEQNNSEGTSDQSTGNMEFTENLEIEVGEDQDIGGF